MTVLDHIHHRVMVSCQAYEDEPLNQPAIMAAMARSVVRGGACAIRAEGLADLQAVREAIDVPLVGLEKIGTDGVFITPTLDSALRVAGTGCDVLALDGTRRPRPDGRDLASTVAGIRERHPTLLIMADCATRDDAVAAVDAGVDIVGSTLAGYTEDRAATAGPDLEVLAEMCASVGVPVVAEGRYHTPHDVTAAFAAGAHSVCVGSAITHPQRITERFVAAVARKATHR